MAGINPRHLEGGRLPRLGHHAGCVHRPEELGQTLGSGRGPAVGAELGVHLRRQVLDRSVAGDNLVWHGDKDRAEWSLVPWAFPVRRSPTGRRPCRSTAVNAEVQAFYSSEVGECVQGAAVLEPWRLPSEPPRDPDGPADRDGIGSGHLPRSRTCSPSVELEDAHRAHRCFPRRSRSAPGLTQGTSTCSVVAAMVTRRQPGRDLDGTVLPHDLLHGRRNNGVRLVHNCDGFSGDTGQSGTPPEVRGQANAWPLPDHDYSNSRDAGTSPIRVSTVSRLRPGLDRADGRGRIDVSGHRERHRLYSGPGGDGLLHQCGVGPGEVADESLLASASGHTACQSVGEWFSRQHRPASQLSPCRMAPRSGAGRSPRRRVRASTPRRSPYGHRVYVPSVPVSISKIYAGGSVGYLEALDAQTGKVDWRFDTIRSKNLWGNPAVNSGGGAWYPPAVDARGGIVYWGVANPAPFVGTEQYPNGSSRPGNNLYTDSMVALSAKSGRLRVVPPGVCP